MKFRHASRAGFTLTEVLVASMLLSIVMTAVYSLFFSVISTWQSEENDEGLHRRARSLLTLLERDYGNLHSGGGALFEGTEDEVTFFVVAQPLDVEAGEGSRLMRVRYHYDRREGTVTRDEAMVGGTLPAMAATEEELGRVRLDLHDEATFVLATDVKEFKLRYLWVQRPDSAYWRQRPETVEPIAASRHRKGWGPPQALAVDLTIGGIEGGQPPLVLSTRIPTRGPNRQRDALELSRMLEGEP